MAAVRLPRSGRYRRTRLPETLARVVKAGAQHVSGVGAARLTLVQSSLLRPFECFHLRPQCAWRQNPSGRCLTTNGCGASVPALPRRQLTKGGGLMTGRMKVLLVALGALGFAAMNGSLPWGP